MSDDETYEVPLQDQRVFGAGIKRKRVKFVPSSSSTPVPESTTGTPSQSIGSLYLSLVLPKDAESSEERSTDAAGSSSLSTAPNDIIPASDPPVCEICSLPLSSIDSPAVALADNKDAPPPNVDSNTDLPLKPRPHEASLAHQVCLTHSHLPSHLDRSRKGLAYLSAYGWDPDSRLGLGSEGQGIAFPIKTKPKDDKLGIGVVVPKTFEKRKEKVEKLDAGRVRKAYEKDKKKGERLREVFYMNDDVERHLRGG